MQFLKTLIWFLLAVIIAVFSIGNWTTVPIRLWAGLVAEVNLPLLLVITFLAGLLPTLLYHHAVKWRLRQKLSTAERALADIRGLAAVSEPTAVAAEQALPPAAAPMAVPPGVS